MLSLGRCLGLWEDCPGGEDMAKSRTPLKECSEMGWAGQSGLVDLMAHLVPVVTLLAAAVLQPVGL